MNQTTKLLKLLSAKAGTRMTIAEIKKNLPAGKSYSSGKKKKGRGKYRKSSLMEFAEDPTIILKELELLGLVEIKSNKVQIAEPFEISGKASVSPQGLVFVTARGADPVARDIFVAPRNSLGALPGDEVSVALRDKKRDRFEGEVTSIDKRARSFFRIKILSPPRRGMVVGAVLDIPSHLSAAFSTDNIASDTKDRIKTDTIIIARLTGKSIYHLGTYFQEARFVRFENDTDMDSDFARILMKYNTDPVYPDLSLPDTESEVNEKTVHDWFKRKDVRNLYTITIDGADSKDFDDALSIVSHSSTRWTVYVHIADVAYYVEPDSPLDDEARARATSYYLANRVVPMLPPVLSENLCSLIQDKNRLAFTAEMLVDPRSGKILKSSFYRSIIKVDKRLTYDIAEQILDNDDTKNPGDLGKMWQLSQIQKAARIKKGRLDLVIPDPSVHIGEDDMIDRISYKPRLKSSMLIEEFMLSANTAVAEYLRKKNAKTLFRVHAPMDEAKLEQLNMFFRLYNISMELKDTKPASLQKALKEVKEKGPLEERIFNMLMLRSFMQAQYRGEPAGHWGLGMQDYCHFTSPIRRYPDLVVHRSLAAILSRKKQPYTKEEIQELGFHTSEQERKAMDAERDMMKLKMIRKIQSEEKKTYHGFLTGFRPDRVFLELEEIPVEGLVNFSHLTNDSELILPDPFSVFIKKLSRPAFLGERWELELEKADAEEMRIYFKPIWGSETRAFQ